MRTAESQSSCSPLPLALVGRSRSRPRPHPTGLGRQALGAEAAPLDAPYKGWSHRRRSGGYARFPCLALPVESRKATLVSNTGSWTSRAAATANAGAQSRTVTPYTANTVGESCWQTAAAGIRQRGRRPFATCAHHSAATQRLLPGVRWRVPRLGSRRTNLAAPARTLWHRSSTGRLATPGPRPARLQHPR